MLKKILFAAAVTGLVAGAALPLQTATAEAGSGCLKAAKAQAGDHASRRAYRKECRARYHAYKSAHRAEKKTAS